MNHRRPNFVLKSNNKNIKNAPTMNEIKIKPVDVYPGVATDVADDDKVNETLVAEETDMMNNNPRNDK